MFAHFSGLALNGKLADLHDQGSALGRALALHENVDQARADLLAASNRHALLDITGIIAWHSLISKVVDMSGFYSAKVPTIIAKLAKLAIFFRRVRRVLLFPLFMLAPNNSRKGEKQQ